MMEEHGLEDVEVWKNLGMTWPLGGKPFRGSCCNKLARRGTLGKYNPFAMLCVIGTLTALDSQTVHHKRLFRGFKVGSHHFRNLHHRRTGRGI